MHRSTNFRLVSLRNASKDGPRPFSAEQRSRTKSSTATAPHGASARRSRRRPIVIPIQPACRDNQQSCRSWALRDCVIQIVPTLPVLIWGVRTRRRGLVAATTRNTSSTTAMSWASRPTPGPQPQQPSGGATGITTANDNSKSTNLGNSGARRCLGRVPAHPQPLAVRVAVAIALLRRYQSCHPLLSHLKAVGVALRRCP